MPAAGTIRPPWSGGDANLSDHLQLRRKTAAALDAENPLLWPGEPAWEIDAKKGKIGDGTTRYRDLPYVIGVGGTASTSIPSNTILGNKTTGTAAATGLIPADARTLLDVPQKSGEFQTLSDDHASHIAQVAGAATTVAGTTTLGSNTITFTTALPSSITNGRPITGPGIPPYTYLRGIATDRLSGKLSSSVVIDNPSWVATTGAGAGSFVLRDRFAAAHGMNVGLMPTGDALTSTFSGYSDAAGNPGSTPAAMTWRERWTKGEKWLQSAEYPVWARMFPLLDYTPIMSHLYVPVPSAFQSWASFPTTTPAEMFGVTRYKLLVALEGATLTRVVVDWLDVAATAGSGAKLKPQYLFGASWIDLCDSTADGSVAIDNGQGPKAGAWGTIKTTAITYAAGQGDVLLLRLVGYATSAAGTPSFGSVRLQLK